MTKMNTGSTMSTPTISHNPTTMRETFTDVVSAALDDDPRLAVLLAGISKDRFEGAERKHPGRVVNMGIREQLLLGVAGGMALTGLRPVVHSIAPFLIERPFEQLKLDLNHQNVGAVLVSIGASYDYAAAGRTHMAPGDVALLDTLPGWTVHVPGHPEEVQPILHSALPGDDRVYVRLSEQVNAEPFGPGTHIVRTGSRGVVLAVGPMLRPVLAATATQDVTVLYTTTVRPFDATALRAAVPASSPDVVLVEPYLSGTSTHLVGEALRDVPHRVLPLGVTREREFRAYGTAEQHEDAHSLSPTKLAHQIRAFLDGTSRS